MLKTEFTGQFKKDYKQSFMRGQNLDKLWEIVTMIAEGKQLSERCKDHALTDSRSYKNIRECHIEPDWLLVYKIESDILILKLIRTGSHSDLF